MQTIEPYLRWSAIYSGYADSLSPFYGHSNDGFTCTHTIYDHYIHPLWDSIGSKTLYLKLQYVDYQQHYAIIELMGEWNDCLYNDIMYLKREVIDVLVQAGVSKFILIGENVLNFHYSDDLYYEEWLDDCEDGWIVALNFRDHVLAEMDKLNLHNYLLYGGALNTVKWRTLTPQKLFEAMDSYSSLTLKA